MYSFVNGKVVYDTCGHRHVYCVHLTKFTVFSPFKQNFIRCLALQNPQEIYLFGDEGSSCDHGYDDDFASKSQEILTFTSKSQEILFSK